MLGGGAEPFQLRGAAVTDEYEGLGGDQLVSEKNALCKLLGSRAG